VEAPTLSMQKDFTRIIKAGKETEKSDKVAAILAAISQF
jgi:hypothetical protein